MMKGLKANSRIMLCNREQDMSRQRFEITLAANASKSCHWRARGPFFFFFFFHLTMLIEENKHNT